MKVEILKNEETSLGIGIELTPENENEKYIVEEFKNGIKVVKSKRRKKESNLGIKLMRKDIFKEKINRKEK